MTALELYLICFIVGFSLSLLSFVLGAFHVGLPRGHALHGAGHAPHGAHGGGHALPGSQGHGPAAGGSSGISPFNFSTLMVFLAWFGGAGVLLTSHWHAGFAVALGVSLAAGLFGASLVFLFLVKVLVPHDRSMRHEDYELPGTLATVTLGIRAGGTGEIAYAQGGTRKSAAARADGAHAIAKGTEVVVVRFEQGIAYVRRWDDLTRLDQPRTLGGSA
jgi:membrane protein implicated in regulation of membrane protease activity